MTIRCSWAEQPPLMTRYHDTEWGMPLFDDRQLFEFLILEGMQAGLSWLTILNKRAAFREAFDRFDAAKIARYDGRKVRGLLGNAGIIRNRLKIEAAIANARAYLAVRERHGRFADYLWAFVDGRPMQRARRSWREIPVETRESRAMSRQLLRDGFRFVGPTICYAHMQATGMVNDHVVACFRHRELQPARHLRQRGSFAIT
ncbi:MAG: DNA-3-methyladenine glycosylase I [Candidatus Omnitrophica bacterium]|nr:DNA-3-methyladenine glycosylase I [Candidatus Omnitrophota bacterium]